MSIRRFMRGRRGGFTRSRRSGAASAIGRSSQRVFHKLLLNFTWWVNRKDAEGRNVFQGGFLGLDNIGVFDRSAPLPTGGHHRASRRHGLDGDVLPELLAIALELASEDPAYEDVASKFWEHFLYIANAINHLGDDGVGHVGRGGRILLRRAAHAGRHIMSRCACGRWSD